jgi:hypothetical protein
MAAGRLMAVEAYAPKECASCGAPPGVICTCAGREIVGVVVEPKPRESGPIERAIEQDLAGMGDRVRPGRLALAEAARKLARVLDARGDEEPASQTAKAVDTLRITMNQIASGEGVDANVQDELAAWLSSPESGRPPVSAEIRYPKEPRAADVGPAGGGDSGSAG